MKRKKTLNKLAALLLSAVMALSLNTAVLAAETNRHAAIDKTAAELKDGRTDVTLAIGAGSEKTSSDVVFVLDKSTSVEVKDAALAMLDELMTRAGENRIKVGVVEFNKTADNEGFVLPLTSLNPDSYAQVEAIFKNELKSGTNIDAGIRAGAAMLAADTSVDNSSKHLVLVTDGVTYMWGDTPTTVFNEVSPDNISRIWSSPSVCGFYPIGKDAAPYANAGQWMADNAAALEKVIENYQQPYGEYQEGAPLYYLRQSLYLLRCRNLHGRKSLAERRRCRLPMLCLCRPPLCGRIPVGAGLYQQSLHYRRRLRHGSGRHRGHVRPGQEPYTLHHSKRYGHRCDWQQL